MNKVNKVAIFVLMLFSLQTHATNFKLDKTRLVFEKSDRRQEFKIYNDSEKLQSFRVTLTEMTMDLNGNLEPADEYALSAKEYLRVGPRVVRDVPPKGFARIRLIKKGLKSEGEFRSHLMIESLTSERVKKVSGVFIQPNFKYIIPVFLKNYSAEKKAKVTLSKHYYSENKKLLLEFKREGIGSFTGNLVVSTKDGKELFRINQVSIYPELDTRIFKTDIGKESNYEEIIITMEELENRDNHQFQTKVKI
ncbi:hypothetical protein ACSLBF_21070 (plasmid) [Pseudoalteromonas sp. T1lg65]|uniref:hypothetical protein n=1 Tax=Pseudoalteromonas sp. T1lg65 TaxID=2077101 RepID=UPI003F7955FF